MEWEGVIGLEVHAQLLTESKMFCHCKAEFGGSPNENTCPVCLGMPGVLPVINKKAILFALKTALSTHCTIANSNSFARKNYFYPDLPKGYQISQYQLPVAIDGSIEIHTNNKTRKIGITRIHLEEDAGKLIHGEGVNAKYSLIDFNRTGTPLLEIVSEPDLRTPDEAGDYLKELRDILLYLEVCDGNMEEGSFRCDANISIRPIGGEIGIKTEVKNMNSFKNVQKALTYEIERQKRVVSEGGTIVQETRLWDAEKGITVPMRGKEEAHDYRYFPEPDLAPVVVSPEFIDEVRKTLPELPAAKRKRFVSVYELPPYDAGVLTSSKKLANYFEECVKLLPKPKIVSNWVMGDILRELNKEDIEIDKCPITPSLLSELLWLIEDNIISGKIAKTVFLDMYATGKSPKTIVAEKGLIQITDAKTINQVVEKILASHKKEVEDYKNGKEKLFGFFVGQIMKETKGKARPELVNEILLKRLSE
ncbi:MAG: Asp-tRNA(Asn)/Glu-tRNA(Gln) amidotransferase subunit GatB [Thermodesulfobacteriota bacterium]|nr:Asp-tRNA(Asn)/Glu-tRNA(Gln) amidotransferase subunit GatB [Thermodesulfobacteriota bacterium]